MLQRKTLIIILVLLASVLFSFTSLATKIALDPFTSRDKTVFDQAKAAMLEKNWVLAQSLLNGLYNQLPNNLAVRNNLAIVLFQQGELEPSQKLFISIIEENQSSAMAYKNLKKLYAYSAAKTYSKGLNLLKPIDLPELQTASIDAVVVDIKQPYQSQLSKGDVITNKPTQIAVITEIEKSNKISTPAIKPPQNKIKLSNTPVIKKVTSGVEDKLLERLEQWRKSWISGDSDAYISLYQANYSPRGKTRAGWVKNRKDKVNPNKRINVVISHSKVYVNKRGDRANTRFEQTYSSKNYSDKVQKRLYWIKQQGQWLIEKESIIKIM